MNLIARFFLFYIFSQILFAIPQNFPFDIPDKNKIIAYRASYDYPENFDPIRSYDEDSNFYISQIYESLYNIDYAAKHFEITPLLAEKMPEIKFYNKENQEISIDRLDELEKTVYRIPIRHGIFYAPNPYLCDLNAQKKCERKRELHAGDFVYAIERLTHPGIQSPFISILNKHLYRFKDYYDQAKNRHGQLHLLSESIRAVDDYTLEIITKGYYAQWIEWLRMPVFSPIPHEIGEIYDKTKDQVIWSKYSIGTGPMMFSGEDSIQKIRLIKNPNYREVYFKTQHGLEKRPMLHEIHFFIEKEAIPRWNKFLQGYYDLTSIPAESFETTIQISPDGEFSLSKKLQQEGIQLKSFSSMSSFTLAFNMNDPVIGGSSESARLLRQAISIAIDYQEFNAIFYNGRGRLAQGPVPPELLSVIHQDTYNPYVYQKINHQIIKRPLRDAKALMRKAGYPDHLKLNLDVETRGLPEERARFSWFRKQFAQIGIHLNIIENDMNRYKQKLQRGRYQMVFSGWSADYPDPENFLMLFYSKNAQSTYHGPNFTNFSNSRYDELFEKLEHGYYQQDKAQLIQEMLEILRYQCVSVWGTFGLTLYLTQKWVDPVNYSPFTSGLMQYVNIHPDIRAQSWEKLNQVEILPLMVLMVLVIVLLLPFVLQSFYFKKAKPKRYHKTSLK